MPLDQAQSVKLFAVVLIPFDGVNVERWPRVMLVFVRVCAVVFFFVFISAFLSMLAPETLANPTPGLLYSKFAVEILISFFALRGTAEPVEAYETPTFDTTSTKLSEAPKSAPAAPQSEPTTSERVPSIPPAPPNPAPLASAPVGSSAQNRLADVEAPPVPNRSNPLCAPPPGVVKERLVTIGSTFLMGAIFAGFFYLNRGTWLAIALLIFFSLAIVLLFSRETTQWEPVRSAVG